MTSALNASRFTDFWLQGVSHSQFYAQYLGNIKLNEEIVDWASADLTALSKVRACGAAVACCPRQRA